MHYNEHMFVLENMQVVHEFDTRSFQANAASYIKGDIRNINFDTSYYSKTIADTIDGMKNIILDKEAVREFANIKIKSGNLNPIRPIDYSDVTFINSQMVQSYADTVITLITGMSSNVPTRDHVDNTIIGTYKYTKKNVVKTTLDYNLPVKDLLGYTNKVKLVIPDSKYITSTIIPFVNGFEKVKADLIKEGKDILLSVASCENSINKIIATANEEKMKSTPDSNLDKKIEYAEYNGIYYLIDLLSYVTYMYMRKVNNFRDNVLNCNRLYVDIVNDNNLSLNESENVINPGMISTTPANLGFNLLQGNTAAYEVLANRVYELYTGKNKVSEIDDVIRFGDDIPNNINGEYTQGNVAYNKDIYINAKKIFVGIGQGLYNICQIPDGLMVRKDDVIYGSGFNIPLTTRYRAALSDIVDISKIQNADFVNKEHIDVATVNSLLEEVKDFSKNMDEISKEIIDAYAILKEIEKRFDYNINNEFKDLDSVKEIEEWAAIFEDEFTQFVNTVAGNFMERLANLAIVLKNINKNMDSQSNSITEPSDIISKAFSYLDVTDYASLETESMVEYNSYLNQLEFETLERAYQILRVKEEMGCDLYFEADEVQKPNEKAKFADNFSMKSGNAIDKLKDKIIKFMDNLIEQFTKALTDNGNDETVKKIISNSNRIINDVDYSQVPAVDIYPYENIGIDTITTNIGKVRDAINGMTPQAIQTIDTKEALYQKLFPLDGFDSTNDLTTQFLWLSKTGNAEASQVKSYQGDDLKNIVQNNMIPFVRDYSGAIGNNIKNSLDDLKNSLNTVVDKYKTVTPTENNKPTNATTNNPQPVAASDNSIVDGLNILEAEEPNKNTQSSMSVKAGWMVNAVNLYCGATLNALRDRNNDYLKILVKLIPADTTQQ